MEDASFSQLLSWSPSLRLLNAPYNYGFYRAHTTPREPFFKHELLKAASVKDVLRPGFWRMEDAPKIAYAVLVICLNIGVDPPDVIKTTPCARLECWIDPSAASASKMLNTIGKALQEQYEHWQPKINYKVCVDPTVEKIKKTCLSIRKSANERVLFHYNGHGVPKPTDNCEIWVFNKGFTQYIPVPVYSIQEWLGNSAVYVFDCSNSGMIIKWFEKHEAQRPSISEPNHGNKHRENEGTLTLQEAVVFAACGANEILPTNTALPADLFTSCMTTPIHIALLWANLNSEMLDIELKMGDQIPGNMSDRHSFLGELNWIFTAVTDTIAWNVLPTHFFQKLFRHDSLLACLFRNFLLAERIMRSYCCTPLSIPRLPPTNNHPMWLVWDLATDQLLSQLPHIKQTNPIDFKHSTFFIDQLHAFEIWLDFGTTDRQPPLQLPIILQVLLSQRYRFEALRLLARFVDMGTWAISQSLLVGIFPYVLKILHTSPVGLREDLVFIWAKLIAADHNCQFDIFKDNEHTYFIDTLSDHQMQPNIRANAALVLCVCCHNSRYAQSIFVTANLIPICIGALNSSFSALRCWSCIAIAQLCLFNATSMRCAIEQDAVTAIFGLLVDPSLVVRAAAVFALSAFMTQDSITSRSSELDTILLKTRLEIIRRFERGLNDGSSQVRYEVAVGLWRFVTAYNQVIVTSYKRCMHAQSFVVDFEIKNAGGSGGSEAKPYVLREIFGTIWPLLLAASEDPCVWISNVVCEIINAIKLVASQTGLHEGQDAMQNAWDLAIQRIRFDSQIFDRLCNEFVTCRRLPPGYGAGVVAASRAKHGDGSGPTRQPAWPGGLAPATGSPNQITSDAGAEPNPLYSSSAQVMAPESLPVISTEIARLELSPNASIRAMAFFTHEPYVIAADADKDVTLINWKTASKVNKMSRSLSAITSISVINRHTSSPLVSFALDNNTVQIWKNVDVKQQMVSAFRAIPLAPTLCPEIADAQFPLVTHYDLTNMGLVASRGRITHLWDMKAEFMASCLETEAAVTSIAISAESSRPLSCQILALGCNDGKVVVCDARLPRSAATVATLMHGKGNSPIVNICTSQAAPHKLAAASANCNVSVWDLRQINGDHWALPTVAFFQADATASSRSQQIQVKTFGAFEHLPLLVIGLNYQRIQLIDFVGNEVGIIRYHDGLFRQKTGFVTATGLHPDHPVFAIGTNAGVAAVFATELFKARG